MKTFTKLLFAIAVLLFAITSCKKENVDDLNDNKSNTELPGNENEAFELVTKKWDLTTSDEYNSIEFTNDTLYIIEKAAVLKSTTSESEIITGKFKVSEDGKAITLIGFGAITINQVNENKIEITIVLEDGTDLGNLSGGLVELVSSSDKTNMLCRTWQVEESTSCGDKFMMEVVFSKYGTAIMDVASISEEMSPDGIVVCGWEIEKRVISWSWKEGNETIIVFENVGKNEDGEWVDMEAQITVTSNALQMPSVTYYPKY